MLSHRMALIFLLVSCGLLQPSPLLGQNTAACEKPTCGDGANGNGVQITRLTNMGCRAGAAVYSPQRKGRLAFEGCDQDNHGGIWLADKDGRHPVLIAANMLSPRFSPNGAKLAYVSGASGDDLFVADGDGSNPVRVNGSTAMVHSYSLSPDGTRIAFSAQPSYGCCFYSLYLAHADGTELRELSNLPEGNVLSPVFAPDGTKVVVEGPGRIGSGIWLLNADGSGQQQILDGTNFLSCDGFNFSPDGHKIYFRGMDLAFQSDIYSIDIDGSRLTNLTNHPNQQKSWPALSPDGCRIVFEDFPDFMIMDADGGNLRVAIPLADPTDRIGTALAPQAWWRDSRNLVFSSPRDSAPSPFPDLRTIDLYNAEFTCRP